MTDPPPDIMGLVFTLLLILFLLLGAIIYHRVFFKKRGMKMYDKRK